MIEYYKDVFGTRQLLRVHGSAAYKAVLPALFSAIVYTLWYAFGSRKRQDEATDHPYAYTALVTSVTFIIVFRANYGYQRVSKCDD